MKIVKALFDVISWLVIAVIALMALYVVSSNYNFFGGYRSFLIQSGSMEPAIMTGDIIVTKNQISYILNDVVAFHNNDNRIVTHRLVAVDDKSGTKEFSTKGDANRSQDFDTIHFEQIRGKVVLVIPKLGYLVAFSKSMPGFLILILIPAILFIVDELFKKKNA